MKRCVSDVWEISLLNFFVLNKNWAAQDGTAQFHRNNPAISRRPNSLASIQEMQMRPSPPLVGPDTIKTNQTVMKQQVPPGGLVAVRENGVQWLRVPHSHEVDRRRSPWMPPTSLAFLQNIMFFFSSSHVSLQVETLAHQFVCNLLSDLIAYLRIGWLTRFVPHLIM